MSKDWTNEAYQKVDKQKQILADALIEIICMVKGDLPITSQIKDIAKKAIDDVNGYPSTTSAKPRK